jgi:hypothetical protein
VAEEKHEKPALTPTGAIIRRSNQNKPRFQTKIGSFVWECGLLFLVSDAGYDRIFPGHGI